MLLDKNQGEARNDVSSAAVAECGTNSSTTTSYSTNSAEGGNMQGDDTRTGDITATSGQIGAQCAQHHAILAQEESSSSKAGDTRMTEVEETQNPPAIIAKGSTVIVVSGDRNDRKNGILIGQTGIVKSVDSVSSASSSSTPINNLLTLRCCARFSLIEEKK